MRLPYRFIFTITATCLLLAGLASAALAIRPFTGEDGRILMLSDQKLSFWALELGFEWSNQSDNPGSHKRWGVPFRLDHFSNLWQISLLGDWREINPRNGTAKVSGMADSRLIIKRPLFIELPQGEALCWYLDAKLPTGDDKKSLLLGTGKTDAGLGLAWTRDEAGHSWHLSTAWQKVGDPANIDLKDRFSFAVGYEQELKNRLTALAELSGASRQHEVEDSSNLGLMLGLRKRLPHSRTLDAGVTFGLTESAPDFQARTGLRWQF